jgi:tmRNA-binding protein
MPKVETIDQFIRAVESNKHDLAIAQFYTENASIQENQSPPRVGKMLLVKNEARTLAKAKSVNSKCILPYFIHGNTVIIKWHFRFEWKDGTYSEIEEIAYQNWQDERIHKEQFFYDPIQLIPRPH